MIGDKVFSFFPMIGLICIIIGIILLIKELVSNHIISRNGCALIQGGAFFIAMSILVKIGDMLIDYYNLMPR